MSFKCWENLVTVDNSCSVHVDFDTSFANEVSRWIYREANRCHLRLRSCFSSRLHHAYRHHLERLLMKNIPTTVSNYIAQLREWYILRTMSKNNHYFQEDALLGHIHHYRHKVHMFFKITKKCDFVKMVGCS